MMLTVMPLRKRCDLIINAGYHDGHRLFDQRVLGLRGLRVIGVSITEIILIDKAQCYVLDA